MFVTGIKKKIKPAKKRGILWLRKCETKREKDGRHNSQLRAIKVTTLPKLKRSTTATKKIKKQTPISTMPTRAMHFPWQQWEVNKEHFEMLIPKCCVCIYVLEAANIDFVSTLRASQNFFPNCRVFCIVVAFSFVNFLWILFWCVCVCFSIHLFILLANRLLQARIYVQR